MSEDTIPIGPPPSDPHQRKLWEMGLRQLVDYMYQDMLCLDELIVEEIQ